MPNSTTRRRVRLTGLATAAVLALGGVTLTAGSGPGAAAPAGPAAALAAPASSPAASDTWQKYVLGPDSPQVYPSAFADPRGNVVRPAALVERNGSMTLTTVAGQTPASVVLDFGKEMSGPLFMDVVRTAAATQGGATPTLQVVTGEARSFLRRAVATTVTQDAAAGATTISVASTSALDVNSEITLGTVGSPTAQVRKVVAFAPATGQGSGAGTITLDAPLTAPVNRAVAATGTTPAVPATPVSSTALGPASDENPGQALVGGNDLLTPTGPGRLETGVHPGFRFALLTLTTPGSLTIRNLGVDFQAFRATPDDYQGWFESSDDELNRLWYAGAYTLQTNLKLPGLRGLPDGRIYDGAKRDGSIWTGDLIIQGPTAVSTLGQRVGGEYLRSSLDELLREQRADGHLPGSPDFNKGRVGTGPNPGTYGVGEGSPIYYSVNYSGYGVRSIIDYFRYTGDADYARRTLAQVEKAVAYNQAFLDTERNLIAPRNPANPADPTYTRGDRDYFQSYQPGYYTKYSVDYYILLREMAWYERAIGSADKAAAYDKTADDIKKAVTSTLWNQQKGFFSLSDLKPDVIAGDVNGLALQYGFVPKGQEGRVLENLKVNWNPFGAVMGEGLVDPTGHTIEPFGIGMETGGRLAVNDTAGAFDLMRRTWGTMIDPANPLYTGAFWEFKNTTGGVNRPTASLAHGWAASPTVQLTEMVLGVRPEGAGYSTWSIKPHPGDLAFSRGRVPTQTGVIDVGWQSDKAARTFAMQVQSPAGTSGTIAVPVAAGQTLTVDGQRVWSNGVALARGAVAEDGYVRFTATGGSHDVRVAPTAAVTAGRTTVEAKVRPKRLTTSTRPKVKVTVRSTTGTVAGRVKVRVDGRLVEKARLKGNGKATVSLDRFRAGRHKVVVVYPGTSTTAGARDVVRVRVTRR